MRLIIFIIALEISSALCNLACRYENYSGGYFSKDRCGCVDFLDYEALMNPMKFKPVLKTNKSDPHRIDDDTP